MIGFVPLESDYFTWKSNTVCTLRYPYFCATFSMHAQGKVMQEKELKQSTYVFWIFVWLFIRLFIFVFDSGPQKSWSVYASFAAYPLKTDKRTGHL